MKVNAVPVKHSEKSVHKIIPDKYNNVGGMPSVESPTAFSKMSKYVSRMISG